MNTERKIQFMDITLRDGEQAVGVIFTRREKAQIANLLAGIGVQSIEAGFPALGVEEKACIKAVMEAAPKLPSGEPLQVYAFARTRREDVQDAAECGVHGVLLSISTSDIQIERKFHQSQAWVMEQIEAAIDEAKQHGLRFIVSAEDASRTGLEFLTRYYQRAEELGATMVRYCDSVGMDDPFRTYQRIKQLRPLIGIPIQVHTHNDFGMATANVMASLRAGADAVAASIGGLGERSGNSPLEEVVMALKHLYGIEVGIDTTRFREVAEYVAGASQRAIPIWKAIIGTNVFAHESGIHADGILKNPQNYEVFSPESVGLERQMIIGKHSGSNAISHKFAAEFGIELSNATAAALLEKVRDTAVELKRPLFDKELMLLYRELEA